MPVRLNAQLDHIILRTPDPAALSGFYARALEAEQGIAGGMPGAFRDDRAVIFEEGRARSLALAAFRFPDGHALAVARERIAGAGVALLPAVSARWREDAFAVADPDGNRIEFGVAPGDGPAAAAGPVARLQHVVVASRDPERLERFYVERLGFGRSDHVLDDERGLRAAFLHSDSEHHSFAIFRADEDRFDHHCYETGSWNDLRDWADHLARQGITLEWGPGRHGAGNNLFLFFHDPDGNWLELSAELETLTDTREPGFWRHEERTLNLWGHGKLRS